MRNHDNELILGNLLEDIHYLHGGIGVERARRFVRKKDIGVIDERTRDCDTLHLTAGHLVRLFVELVAKPYLFQRLGGALSAFARSDAGERQCKLNIGQNRLVRDKVVRLKNETDGMVSVSVPVRVREIFCGLPVDDQITGGVVVKSADDIEHSGFTAAGVTENCYKLALPKLQTDALQRGDLGVRNKIVLFDFL